MPRVFIHFPFFFFSLIALSGVWMRLLIIYPNTLIPYTHVLHGHSHLAILGWAFLGAFIVFLHLFWPRIPQKKEAIVLTYALFITSTMMFFAFLYQGYDILSIIMSSTHIFIEYWAAAFIYRQLKTNVSVPKYGKFFVNSGLISLVISSIGPFALGFISANGLKNSYFFDLAMYFYLHFQYNGWLTLFLIGAFIIILYEKSISIYSSLLSLGFWFYFISLFPSYFLSVLWVDLGSYSTILAIIGSIGQWLGIVFILLAFKSIWKGIGQHLSKLTLVSLAFTFLLLFFKSIMELGLMIPSLAPLIYETRSIVIGYLHLTLLGFVSIFILSQFLMLKLIPCKKLTSIGFIVFIGGFILNELLLFCQGLLEWLGMNGIHFYNEGLLLASGFLLIGIVMLWLTTSIKQHRSL